MFASRKIEEEKKKCGSHNFFISPQNNKEWNGRCGKKNEWENGKLPCEMIFICEDYSLYFSNNLLFKKLIISLTTHFKWFFFLFLFLLYFLKSYTYIFISFLTYFHSLCLHNLIICLSFLSNTPLNFCIQYYNFKNHFQESNIL